MNHVALVGRLTKDPELRMVGDRRAQASFTLAVNRSFKNQQGEIDADFILCSIWGKTAESTARHCGKGSLIGISGRIQTRTYERQDRTRAYVTEIIGEDVRFIQTKKPASADHQSAAAGSPSAETEREAASAHFELPPSKPESEALPIY
ncbi:MULTISPECIES: single-stranded DNA-binding protein [Sporosarcina]|uniref:single-stranded DNA-binding protein n=1 Tax=Sporosarcina TaxID=1569 RepID=UPI0009E3DC90|nr:MULTISPECIES: single-stranded DNA-binding protein [Sporosarcina]WJY26486.1 single-stranded DNA-binding protein [Sporosarcina sp. 0.2-SM1T-5]